MLPISFEDDVHRFPVHVIDNLHHVTLNFSTNTMSFNDRSKNQTIYEIHSNAGYARSTKKYIIRKQSEKVNSA